MKQSQVVKNTSSSSTGHKSPLAAALIFCTGLSLISGGYYYLWGPANWNAAQIILSLHIGVGIITTFMLLGYLKNHLPWGLRSKAPAGFLVPAFLFLGCFLCLLGAGLFNTTPLFLYLAKIIWFPQFETFDLVANAHLIFALLVAGFLFIHLTLFTNAGTSGPREAIS